MIEVGLMKVVLIIHLCSIRSQHLLSELDLCDLNITSVVIQTMPEAH